MVHSVYVSKNGEKYFASTCGFYHSNSTGGVFGGGKAEVVW